MLVLKWLSLLALATFTAADVPELIVDKTYVPENCTVKSAKGDGILVHYVSLTSPSWCGWLSLEYSTFTCPPDW